MTGISYVVEVYSEEQGWTVVSQWETVEAAVEDMEFRQRLLNGHAAAGVHRVRKLTGDS